MIVAFFFQSRAGIALQVTRYTLHADQSHDSDVEYSRGGRTTFVREASAYQTSSFPLPCRTTNPPSRGVQGTRRAFVSVIDRQTRFGVSNFDKDTRW